MNRRDVSAAWLVGLAVAVWLLGSTPWVGPVIGGVRGTALIVAALGLWAAVVGGSWRGPVRPTVMRGPAALGLLAVLATVATLLTGSATTLAVLVLLVVALWALATLRHAGARRG